jgi:hypothetical protein
VPYHCREHGAHVLQGMHVLLTRGQVLEGSLDPVSHLACLLAAVREPGLKAAAEGTMLSFECFSAAMPYGHPDGNCWALFQVR